MQRRNGRVRRPRIDQRVADAFSDLVNSPKTDDARCIEPVAIDRDFFERQWWGDG